MRVVSNPKIMMGKPTIAGTRITVESILERLAEGESQEQIIRHYVAAAHSFRISHLGGGLTI